MYRKSARNINPRVTFDPSNVDHMREYAMFIRNNNWTNGCRFYLEDPYMDIPTMLNAKIVEYVMKSY